MKNPSIDLHLILNDGAYLIIKRDDGNEFPVMVSGHNTVKLPNRADEPTLNTAPRMFGCRGWKSSIYLCDGRRLWDVWEEFIAKHPDAAAKRNRGKSDIITKRNTICTPKNGDLFTDEATGMIGEWVDFNKKLVRFADNDKVVSVKEFMAKHYSPKAHWDRHWRNELGELYHDKSRKVLKQLSEDVAKEYLATKV